MGRRVISMPLPASDPHSAAIVAWLDAQPAGVDIAPAVRRLLAEALAVAPRLATIEAKLDQVLAGRVLVAPPAESSTNPPADAQMVAAVDELLDFGV
jgi:predicted alpha/beta hydrolase family esterase